MATVCPLTDAGEWRGCWGGSELCSATTETNHVALKSASAHTTSRLVGYSSSPILCTAKKIWFMYSQERRIHCKDSIPKIRTNIPRNETARPQSLFPHSCFCEQFICIFPRSVCLFSCSRISRPIVGIFKSLTEHECRNWDWGRPVSFLGIIFSNFRF